MAQALPSNKVKCFDGTCFPWKCCKVFCALVVTVKTCVLRLTTKKVNFFESLNLPPPPEKNAAGAHDCCWSDSAVVNVDSVRKNYVRNKTMIHTTVTTLRGTQQKLTWTSKNTTHVNRHFGYATILTDFPGKLIAWLYVKLKPVIIWNHKQNNTAVIHSNEACNIKYTKSIDVVSKGTQFCHIWSQRTAPTLTYLLFWLPPGSFTTSRWHLVEYIVILGYVYTTQRKNALLVSGVEVYPRRSSENLHYRNPRFPANKKSEVELSRWMHHLPIVGLRKLSFLRLEYSVKRLVECSSTRMIPEVDITYGWAKTNG